MKVTVLQNQTLSDIALQVYGTIEGVFVLATDNDLSVTDELKAGQVLECQADKVINKQIVQYYSDNNIHPATAFLYDVDNRIFDNTFNLTFN